MKIQGSKVLLTGANGGIGRAFVDELLQRGVAKLYAGVRSPDGQSLPSDPRLELIQLDVTNPANIEAAARKAGDGGFIFGGARRHAQSEANRLFDE